jgi:hypothetical protein
MSAVKRTTLTLALLVTLGAGSAAFADHPVFRFAPPYGRSHGESTLGINYTVIPGYGYRVNYTYYPSLAQRIGFERGDVILSINGWRLSSAGAHEPGFRQATCRSGWFYYSVRDVRSGRVITRWANLYH